jgi:hypothetical protein
MHCVCVTAAKNATVSFAYIRVDAVSTGHLTHVQRHRYDCSSRHDSSCDIELKQYTQKGPTPSQRAALHNKKQKEKIKLICFLGTYILRLLRLFYLRGSGNH